MMKIVLLFGTCFFILNLSLDAQINVANEPLHKTVFENQNLRVLEIIAKADEGSLMHLHEYNYCYISIQSGEILLQNQGEEERVVKLPSGYIGGVFDTDETPYIHRFKNLDDQNLHFIAVESKAKKAKEMEENEEGDHVIDNEYFRVTKTKIEGFVAQAIELDLNTVIVNPKLDNLSFFDSNKNTDLGLWQYFEKGSKVKISSVQSVQAELILFQVK